jgi:polyisoprenoid-binding protein YceI
MNNNILVSIIVIVVIVIGLVLILNRSKQEPVGLDKPNQIENLPEGRSTVLIDGDYKFSPSESQIIWQGKKTILTNWIDEGTIALSSGGVKIEDGLITSGNIVIDMNSISSTKTGANNGENQLSAHLKSADFFNAEVHPTSEFKMTSISLGQNGLYNITGDLTIKETTKNIEFPILFSMKDNNIFVNGQITINRADFDVRFGSSSFFNDLGDNLIDDNFILKLNLVGIKQ